MYPVMLEEPLAAAQTLLEVLVTSTNARLLHGWDFNGLQNVLLRGEKGHVSTMG